MNKIAKIRQEIERLKEPHERNLNKPMEQRRIGYAHGCVDCCDKILDFIDSQPEDVDSSENNYPCDVNGNPIKSAGEKKTNDIEIDLLTKEQLEIAREINIKQGLLPALRYIVSVVPEFDSRLAKEYYEKYIAVPQMNYKEKITEWGKVWYFNNTENTFRFEMYQYDDDPDTIYLSNVFVSSEYRGIGLGNGILNAADRIAKNKRVKTIFLKVKKGSFAHEWYKRHGYVDVETGEEDNTMIWMKKEV